MKIFDLEYHFYRTWRKARFNLMKKRRLQGYVVPPRMKKVSLILLGLGLLFTLVFLISQQLVKRTPAPVNNSPVVQEESTASHVPTARRIPDASAVPDLTARAVLLVDTNSGTVLYEKNADEPLPPASITKVLTAILALENYETTEMVKVPSSCIGLEGNQVGLVEGEQWTVKEMLYGMLVLSASDATCALASHVSQVTDYVAGMNLRAQALGLKETRFANPIGLEDPGHRSSARDLVSLGKLAMQNGVIREVVGTQEINVQKRKIVSTNELLGKVEGLVGVKTGFTEEAGECFLFAVEREGKNVTGVVLGSKSRFTEAKQLIDWVYQTHVWE